MSQVTEIQNQFRDGNTLPIDRILKVNDIDAFLLHSSSYRPYEAIFGYSFQDYRPETHAGSIYDTDNGYFNMTNPASLVFPEINGLYPFERIKVEERDRLEVFVQRSQPAWRIPGTQAFLNFLSFIVLILSIGGILTAILRRYLGKKDFT